MIDLFSPGAYMRCPGGNIEGAQDQKQAIKWAAWNIGSDPCVNRKPEVWDIARNRWDSAGIVHFPWLHCRSIADLEFLISVGHRYARQALGANFEDVFADGIDLAEVASVLASQWGKQVHIASLPWLQNDQGWGALKDCVFALEIMADEQTTIFPSGEPDPVVVDECIDHAFAEGAELVTLMLKTKGFVPDDYGRQWPVCHSLYAGDDITPSAQGWAAWKQDQPCTKLEKETPMPPVSDEKQWYEKPYLTGPPVGPNKVPRALYPPSVGKGIFTGDDVLAYKRGVSRAGRCKPWAPSTWSPTYGEPFAMGKGTGNVGDSGVRGFQRQQFPNDKSMHTGNIGDKTYQAMRRALVSDPDAPNFKEPIFDSTAIKLLNAAAKEQSEGAKETQFRNALADFCERAEDAASEKWTYSQARPFTGLGVAPEKAHVNDCSSYVVLAYYWARQQSGLLVPDPSGYNYGGFGNTWDDLDGHPSVTSGNYLVGDLAHYDGHVTICRRKGDRNTAVWSSFGSEPKPEPKELHYRSDFVKVVRPPLG